MATPVLSYGGREREDMGAGTLPTDSMQQQPVERMQGHVGHVVNGGGRIAGRAKPAPKLNGYDEIIQDGLGSDELIPSEWATGSRARFLTANRQERSQYDRRDASRSVSDSYSQQQQPVSQARSPSYGASRGGSEWQDASNLSASKQSPTRGVNITRDRDLRHALGTESEFTQYGASAMARTASNPGLTTADKVLNELDVNQMDAGIGSQIKQRDDASGKRARTSSQGSAALLKNGSPSRIPTLNRLHAGQSKAVGSTSSPQAGAKYIRADTGSLPRAQAQDRQRTQSNSSASRRSASKRDEERHHQRDTSTSHDVLGEFGPLGGTPQKSRTVNDEGALAGEEFGVPASSSNPWDEELLPTVKRRLAQQAMLSNGGSRLSGVDGLVDTWDRNGMPLSTLSITPRKSSIRDVVYAADGKLDGDVVDSTPTVEEVLQADGDERKLGGSSNDRPSTAASERMKRLTDQLDFGLQPGGKRGLSTKAGVTNVGNGQDDVPALELKDVNQQGGERDEGVAPKGAEHISSEQLQRQRRQADVQRDADVGGGCCKCTVM